MSAEAGWSSCFIALLLPFCIRRKSFAAHAINLTTDTTDVGAWQGGDIVVYSNHIGIASDTRNSHGLPLLIHPVSATQKQYEEDVLGTFPQELVGHDRIS